MLSPFCKVDTKSTYTSSGLKHMKVSSIYRAPHGDHKKCIEKLREILSHKENFKKEIWFLGDFNVDFLKRNDINFKRFQSFFETFLPFF